MARNTFRVDEKLDEQSEFRFSHLARLGKYIQPYKNMFGFTLFFTITSSALSLLAPALTMMVMDDAIPNNDTRLVLQLAGFMLGTIILNIFFMR
jgi:ATP-binding cassette subfamily B protein